MTLFSVVIPVYNIERYLEHCLDSIISQNYEKLQIILVDDGSLDKSGVICDEYAAKDLRIEVIHKKNGGVVSARLQGVNNCKGEYIVCVDGDDWLDNDFFIKLDNVIKCYSPDVICTGYKSVGLDEIINNVPYDEGFYNRDRMEKQIFPSLICDAAGKIFPQHLWAKAFKNSEDVRKMFDIDQRINMGEDSVIVVTTMAMVNTLYILNEPLYCYRYNPDSLTKSNNALRWDNPKIWYKEIVSKLKANKTSDFKEQIYRNGALSVFYIAASQFNLDDKYTSISRLIRDQLNDGLYSQYIRHAKFNKGCKQSLKIIVLKYRIIILLKLFCKTYYKNRK